MGSFNPNKHTINAVVAALKAQLSDINVNAQLIITKSELDLHANMIVVGKDYFIFESTGKTCNVEPFTADHDVATNIPIVDAALAYDCPFTHETYILIIRNTLYIDSMKNNLIPPFIMREGGVIVNDIPKMHSSGHIINDHCISFKDTNLGLPLLLNGIFSYFHTRKLSARELYSKDKTFLTPVASEWKPHCQSYSHNESIMTNYEGDITSIEDQHKSQLNQPLIQMRSLKWLVYTLHVMIMQLTLLSSTHLKLQPNTHHVMILMLALLHV